MTEGGLSYAKMWGTGITISAFSFIMYSMFAKLIYKIGYEMKLLHAPQAVQESLIDSFNWGFIIIGAGGILIPLFWTFLREMREREY